MCCCFFSKKSTLALSHRFKACLSKFKSLSVVFTRNLRSLLFQIKSFIILVHSYLFMLKTKNYETVFICVTMIQLFSNQHVQTSVGFFASYIHETVNKLEYYVRKFLYKTLLNLDAFEVECDSL